MADDIKADELIEPLRDSYAQSIRTMEPGIPAHAALQLADALLAVQLDVLAGKRVSYKAKPPIDGEAIAESWRLGMPVEEVMRKHGCSRPTAYRWHPSKAKRAG